MIKTLVNIIVNYISSLFFLTNFRQKNVRKTPRWASKPICGPDYTIHFWLFFLCLLLSWAFSMGQTTIEKEFTTGKDNSFEPRALVSEAEEIWAIPAQTTPSI